MWMPAQEDPPKAGRGLYKEAAELHIYRLTCSNAGEEVNVLLKRFASGEKPP